MRILLFIPLCLALAGLPQFSSHCPGQVEKLGGILRIEFKPTKLRACQLALPFKGSLKIKKIGKVEGNFRFETFFSGTKGQVLTAQTKDKFKSIQAKNSIFRILARPKKMTPLMVEFIVE